MIGFIGKRAFNSAISIFGLLVLVFVLTRLTGDPAALFLPLDSSLEARQEFNRLNGFDRPVVVQFASYLADLARLDFGMSLRQNRPAMEVALEAFPRTLQLAALAMTIAFSAALVIGALAAARPGAGSTACPPSYRWQARARPTSGSRSSRCWSSPSVSAGCRHREPAVRSTGSCRSPF